VSEGFADLQQTVIIMQASRAITVIGVEYGIWSSRSVKQIGWLSA
jgi:hypothetical protein